MTYFKLSLICLPLLHCILCAPIQDSSNYQNMLSKDCIQCLLKATKHHHPQIAETKRSSPFKTFNKKDVFVSRGWGAGGMPFSVLYMNPSHSSKAPSDETVRKPTTTDIFNAPQQQQQQHQHKSVPQVRNSMRQKSIHRISHSVIPQLFVSYGWGPHGKK